MAKNAMLNVISKADFNRKVVEATNIFRDLYNNGLPVAVAAEGGSKCAAIKETVESVLNNNGLDNDTKLAIIKTLMDSAKGAKTVAAGTRRATSEELDKQRLTFVPFAAVVVLRNRNHHAYPIGDTFIMVHGEKGADNSMFGMDKNGCIINRSTTAKDGLSHLPRYRKSIRPATNSEIFAIVDRLYR